jgi:hypothetical protein
MVFSLAMLGMMITFRRERLRLLVLLAAFAAGVPMANAGEDRDGDGLADNEDRLLLVLREGIQADPGEEKELSADPSLAKWKMRRPAGDFGRTLRRWSGKPGLESVRQLSRHPSRQHAKPQANRDRQILKLRIDRTKISLREAIAHLAEDPAVQAVEPDFAETAEINDPYFSTSGSWGQAYPDQWYLQAIQAPAAWASVPPSAPGVVVAVIDTGVDRTHPDLANVAWTNAAEIAGNGIDDDLNGYVDDKNGWNFASSNSNTLDTYGHGTLVAGLIAAEQDNGIGMAGVATGVRIMALRNGEGGTSYVSRSIEALYYAVDHGAQVVNMSFGGANYSMAFAEAIRYASDHGVVLVASSGNSSVESISHYPSGYRGVISVGASDDSDQVATFSNYGPAVHLVAPGGGGSDFSGRTILGSRATNTTLGLAVDASHVRSSGTSFSSPMVAATAAMLLRKDPALTPGAIRQILISSADDLEAPGWSLKSSYGRLNMQRALASATPALAEIDGIANGQVVSGSVQVFGTASAPGLTGYVLEYGVGKVPDFWTQIGSGNVAVVNGLLGAWSTTGLVGGDYTLRLRVSTSGAPSGESRVCVFVGVKAPASRPGWPKAGLINNESPTVMDLDGDGTKEVVLSLKNGVNVYQQDGTPFRAGSYTGALVWPSGPAAVGDIDGDGELEIGMISKSGTSTAYPEFHEVRFWNLDGTTCTGWPISLVRPNDYVPHSLSPTLVDVDGDGRCEVIFPSVTANKSHPVLCFVRGDGSPMPGWPKTLTSSPGAYIHCTTGVADLDGNGALDLVVADSSGKVHAFSLSGSYLTGWPRTVAGGSHIAQELALTDLDRDGRTDVITTFYNGVVSVLDHGGAPKPGWPKLLGSIPRPPAIADLDGDGDLEFAVGTQSGSLEVFHHTGIAMSGWPKQVFSRFYSPSLVDLDHDGRIDVVASDGNRTIHAWKADGSQLSSLGFPFQLPGSFGCYSPPVVEDLDADGKLELVVLANDLEVRNLAAIANPQIQPFSHMHCDPANTCRYVLPARIGAGQKFFVSRTGGETLDLAGYGFLAGSTVKVGQQGVTAGVTTSESMALQLPSGLPLGWQDIRVTHPNAGVSWLADAVLVVEDAFGDTDGDDLPDRWEWDHGFDVLVSDAAGAPTGPLGDPDGDGLSNLVEAAFAAMQLDPNLSDVGKLPPIRFQGGKMVGEYSRDRRDRFKIVLSWSPDMKVWLKPGDSAYPADSSDTDLGTGTGDLENRRVEVMLPSGGRGFGRWSIEAFE